MKFTSIAGKKCNMWDNNIPRLEQKDYQLRLFKEANCYCPIYILFPKP